MPTDPDAILDLIHESVVMTDLAGRVTFWNSAASRLYGWGRTEVIGRDIRTVTGNDDLSPLIEDAACQAAGAWEGEVQRRTASGSEILVEVRQALRRDESGAPVAVVETSRDVTARRADEVRLRYSEHRYRNLFQAMAAAFWEIDFSGVDDVLRRVHRAGVKDFAGHFAAHPDDVREMMRAARVIDVNDQTVRLFGGGSDKQALLRDLEPFWAEGCEHVFTDGILAGMAGRPNYSTETRLRALDGREFDALFTASFPPDTMGKGTLVIGVIDISERKRAERELQKAQSDFAHAARVSMLGELTASIAHEINQPLAAIATNGEAGLRWLNRDVPDLGEVQQITTRIVADARRAADIILRIRALASNHAPEQSMTRINAVIRDSVKVLRHEIDANRVALTLDLADDLPDVMADRVQLQQVIVNLAINAIHAMADQAGPRRLAFKTGLDGDTLVASVEDNGSGIGTHDPARLFDSFFTTKAGGMGIGLAVCRSIVEAHGGWITAENRAGGGARLAFTLPVRAADKA